MIHGGLGTPVFPFGLHCIIPRGEDYEKEKERKRKKKNSSQVNT